MPSSSPTHDSNHSKNSNGSDDSEDWLDEIMAKLMSYTTTHKQAKLQILDHYAHYLKPEEAEAIIGDDESEGVSDATKTVWAGAEYRNSLRAEQRQRLSKLKRVNGA